MIHAPAATGFIAGKVAYRNAAGEETGRERFEIVSHAGGRTLRALCEMDDFALLRDVTIALDHQWRPLDAFCRVTREGKTIGTTLFLTEGGGVQMEGVIDGLGRMSQQVRLPQPLVYLGLHPVIGDALIVQARGDDEPGVFRPIACMTNSISPNGDQGLYLKPVTIDVAYMGHEAVTVAAGQFQARRFALRWSPQWPPADLWVRAEDCVLVKLQWDMVKAWYELTELEVRP